MSHILGYAHGGLEGWFVCVTEHMSSSPSPMVARRKIEDKTDTWWTVGDLSLANLAQVWESELGQLPFLALLVLRRSLW